MSARFESVLITGASGAIGRELALAYAGPGVDLVLQGRRSEALAAVARACEQAGARVVCHTLDLADAAKARAWAKARVAEGLPALVIANAGRNTHADTPGGPEPWDETEQLLDLNIKSTVALTQVFAEAMRRRGAGQLALISSLAGWHGLPVTPVYSASKAAIKAYGEALRGRLRPYGVGVTVVMPGYVHSPMSEAMPGPKPWVWPPARAARRIRRAVQANRARVSFPFPLNWGCWWLAVLPAPVAQWFLRRLGFAR